MPKKTATRTSSKKSAPALKPKAGEIQIETKSDKVTTKVSDFRVESKKRELEKALIEIAPEMDAVAERLAAWAENAESTDVTAPTVTNEADDEFLLGALEVETQLFRAEIQTSSVEAALKAAIMRREKFLRNRKKLQARKETLIERGRYKEEQSHNLTKSAVTQRIRNEIVTLRAFLARRQNTVEPTDTINYTEEKPKAALKAEGDLNAYLQKYLRDERIPRELWSEVAAGFARVLDEIRDTQRQPWIDEVDEKGKPKPKPAELANLSAPAFLKKVWASKFLDGAIRSEDGAVLSGTIRSEDVSDKALLRAVSQYMSNREDNNKDYGDANGLTIAKSARGRPKTKTLSMS